MDEANTCSLEEFLELVPTRTEQDFIGEIEAASGKAEFQAALIRNMSTRAAAATLGVSHSTVARLKQNTPPTYITGKDGRARLSRIVPGLQAARKERIHQLRKDGRSIREIAKELKCSPGTVHRVLSQDA